MTTRCSWVNENNPLYISYHDEDWGVPVRDDQTLFEMLCLEGAQAGLSWETVLNKRENYRRLFKQFDIDACARLSDKQLDKILLDAGIIRNRLKVYSVRSNALAAKAVQAETGSLSEYIWSFVDGKPLQNNFVEASDAPARTEISDQMSKALKKRGFKFIGSTICYAFMQACGLVNDHSKNCFRYRELKRS